MTSLFKLSLLLLLAFNPFSKSSNDEVILRLQDDEKLIGTFSGDIDQQTSVHLIVVKDKNNDRFLVKPVFIDDKKKIKQLEVASFAEKPTVLSYHLQNERLTLMLQQGKRKEEKLEILEFNINNGDFRRLSIDDFEEPYLLMRTREKTFLFNKNDNQLEIITVTGAESLQKRIFSNLQQEDVEKLFKLKPDPINTNEFVEHGSINPSKLYYSNQKLIFDYKSKTEYLTLSLDPESVEFEAFKVDLNDVDRIKEVNAYIHDNKVFLFLNDKEDIHLRTYDLGTGELVAQMKLREEFPAREDLKKMVKKSSRKNFSLTATINEGVGNSLVINLDNVPTREYFYHYNWWFHHMMFQNMMMQQQMMQQQMMRQVPFGPKTMEDDDLYYFSSSSGPVQLVMDSNFKLLKNSLATPVRPQIDKDKYLDIFQKNKMLEEQTVAFTEKSVRTVYFSKVTDAVHISVMDM